MTVLDYKEYGLLGFPSGTQFVDALGRMFVKTTIQSKDGYLYLIELKSGTPFAPELMRYPLTQIK